MAQPRTTKELFDGILTVVDRRDVEKRREQPAAQQTRAGRSRRLIDRMQQASFTKLRARVAFDFQVALRRVVERQRRRRIVQRDGMNVMQVVTLRFTHVLHQCAGG